MSIEGVGRGDSSVKREVGRGGEEDTERER